MRIACEFLCTSLKATKSVRISEEHTKRDKTNEQKANGKSEDSPSLGNYDHENVQGRAKKSQNHISFGPRTLMRSAH